MIEKEIKSIYEGHVAFHEKYYNQAIEEGEGLRIIYRECDRCGEPVKKGCQCDMPEEKVLQMEISAGEVADRRVTEHEEIEVNKVHNDRHTPGEEYKLAYFKWDGEVLQDKLL